jgi:hypothetical protein
MASRYNFKPGTYAGVYEDRGIKVADQFSQDIYYRDSTSAVVDLTSYTADMGIRDQADSGADILTLSTANSRITLTSGGDPTADPNILLRVTATDTSALSGEVGDKFYDLRLLPSDVDQAFTLIEGVFTIRY